MEISTFDRMKTVKISTIGPWGCVEFSLVVSAIVNCEMAGKTCSASRRAASRIIDQTHKVKSNYDPCFRSVKNDGAVSPAASNKVYGVSRRPSCEDI